LDDLLRLFAELPELLLVSTDDFALTFDVAALLLYDGRVVILGLLYVGLYVLCVELYTGFCAEERVDEED
jgi:hypothetical protein